MSRNRKYRRKHRRKRGLACVWCGRQLSKATATVEHMIPKCHGGPDEPWNLDWSCFDCNNNRGSDVATPSARARIAEVLADRDVPPAWQYVVSAIRDGYYYDKSFDRRAEARI